MKNNKSLILVVTFGILVLGGLLFSVGKMASGKNKVFYESGYVSVSRTEKNSKVYFSSGTNYKKTYSGDIVFKSKDNQKSEVPKESFVYYKDKSISYLTDGVLMPLEDISSSLIPYYNIKSNYLIKYVNSKYVIEAVDKDITMANFIGKISENKYVIAGNDLRLKTSNSPDYVSDYYFEILFTDKEIVKITNENIDLSTISSETYIMVGNNIKIDLNNLTISENGEVIVNLGEITIGDDDNIDILYEEPNQIGSGEGTDEPNGGIGGDGDFAQETVIGYKTIPYLELFTTSVNSNRISLKFNVIDTNNLMTADGFEAIIKDLNTNQVVFNNSYVGYKNPVTLAKDNLSANHKYMITIRCKYIKNGNIYNLVLFQRTFATSDIGVELTRNYVTNDKLSYKVSFNDDSIIERLKVNLYDKTNNLIRSEVISKSAGINSYNVLFSDLESNSTYTVKIEDMVIGGVVYPDDVASFETRKTLKNTMASSLINALTPVMEADLKERDYILDLTSITDIDNAITDVLYQIYDEEGTLIKEISKKGLDKVKLKEAELNTDKEVYFNAIITEYDGEKYIESETLNSNRVKFDGKRHPYAAFKAESITSSTIEGTYFITDEDEVIIPNSYYMTYNYNGMEVNLNNTKVDVSENKENGYFKANIKLLELKGEKSYIISLYSKTTLSEEDELLSSVKITTAEANVIDVKFKSNEIEDKELLLNNVFDLNFAFSRGGHTAESIVENFSYFELHLYENSGIYKKEIGVLTEDDHEKIMEYFSSDGKTLNISDFIGNDNETLSYEKLRLFHQGEPIAKNYSLAFTSGKSGDEIIEFQSSDILEFEIADELIEIADFNPSIEIVKILNTEKTEEDLYEDTVIGFKANITLDSDLLNQYIKVLKLYIVDVTSETLEEALANENYIIKEYPVSFEDTDSFEQTFMLNEYEELVRGNIYVIGVQASVDFSKTGNSFIQIPKNDMVKSEELRIEKQFPNIIAFPYNSTNSDISFKYDKVEDIDNTINDNNVYIKAEDNYFVGTSVECISNNNYSCIKFTNLSNLVNYKLLFKIDLYNRIGEENTDYELNEFTFKGENSLSNLHYNISLEGVKSKYNNIIEIKLDNETLDKLVSVYTVALTTGNEKFVIKNIYDNKIGTNNIIEYYDSLAKNKPTKSSSSSQNVAYYRNCDDGIGKCIYVDYSSLYLSEQFGSYFEHFRNNLIHVLVSAYYDSGLIDYPARADKQMDFSKNRYYTYQIWDLNSEYNNNYLKSTGDSLEYKDNNLGIMYGYTTSYDNYYGFVDDYNNNNGKISLMNFAYTNMLPNNNKIYSLDYLITKKGVEICLLGPSIAECDGNKLTPVVSKLLSSVDLTGTDVEFVFNEVVPSVKLSSNIPTLNGIIIKPIISGEKDASDEEIIIDVFDKSTDEKAKSYVVNKSNLEQMTLTKTGNSFYLPIDKGYYYDISAIKSVANSLISKENYHYNYETGEIILKNQSIDQITIEYRLVLSGLEMEHTYYLKVKNNSKYFIDSSSTVYNDFAYEFTTKKLEDVNVTEIRNKIISHDYDEARDLEVTYKINEIFGITDLKYEICLDTKCINMISSAEGTDYETHHSNMNMTYYSLNGSTYSSVFKVNTIYTGDDANVDFVYGTTYKLKMSAKINGSYYELFINKNSEDKFIKDIDIRKLYLPVFKFEGYGGSNTVNNAPNYYLKFNVLVTDDDYVLKDAKYQVGLVPSSDNLLSSALNDYYGSASGIAFNNLSENKEYKFGVVYGLNINNYGEVYDDKIIKTELFYTVYNYGVSIGEGRFLINNNQTNLRFYYTSNFAKANDDSQEAYVVGIQYELFRPNGNEEHEVGNVLNCVGCTLYSSEGEINYKPGTFTKENGDASDADETKRTDSFHSIVFNQDLTYIPKNNYRIIYRLLIAGNFLNSYNTKESCVNADMYWIDKSSSGMCATIRPIDTSYELGGTM